MFFLLLRLERTWLLLLRVFFAFMFGEDLAFAFEEDLAFTFEGFFCFYV